jgi:hypothetical protein
MCDATLYVVRQEHTPKVHIKKFDEQSKIKPLKNVAIIFNGVTESGYGYGYTYAYGFDKEGKAAESKTKKKALY